MRKILYTIFIIFISFSVTYGNEQLDIALVKAVKEQNFTNVKNLILKGANVNAEVNGVSPLIWSCYNGNIFITVYLIEHGANIYYTDRDGDTTVVVASLKGHQSIVSYLVSIATAESILTNSQSRKSAMDWAKEKGFTGIVQILENAPKQIAINSKFSNACWFESLENVKNYLYQGANINALNWRGANGLLLATFRETNEALPIVKYLLGKSINLKAYSFNGWTPLHVASYKGKIELIKLFISHRMDVNIRHGRFKTTPLMFAAQEGHLEILNYLLSKGADPCIATPKGYRASWFCTAEPRDYGPPRAKPENIPAVLKILKEREARCGNLPGNNSIPPRRHNSQGRVLGFLF